MAAYSIEWKPSALRELKHLERRVVAQVFQKIEELAENPFPPGVCKLQGTERTYRIRQGDYRIIYDVLADRLLVLIIRVRHRRDAYR
jgi:mRNA interferase RelE/StbE